ncbi:MAG: glycosyltransferase family 4 protein [Alphaproteobacteria bacterium]
MRVAVAVHGRFHAFDLAAYLHGRGLLAGLVTTYPDFATRRFVPKDAPVTSAAWLEAWRRLHARLKLPGSTDVFVAKAFGRFTARHLPVGADLLVGWSAASLEAITAAHARGMKVVIERGSSHIVHQTEVLDREHERFDLPWRRTDQRLIERELAEYERADAIAVPTSYAAETFKRRGIPAERLIVNPYGVDLALFRPSPPRPPDTPVRILFVGRVGVRKGVPWLLRAFALLDARAELHLVGPVEPGMDKVLALEPMERVVVRGPLPGAQLPQEYAAADIFCLPSLEEGLPLVVLQAMASGLAVVATPETGAGDVIRDGIEGRLVPSGDPRALAAALDALAGDPLLRSHMGDRARRAVESGLGWDDYGKRAVAAYEKLLGS